MSGSIDLSKFKWWEKLDTIVSHFFKCNVNLTGKVKWKRVITVQERFNLFFRNFHKVCNTFVDLIIGLKTHKIKMNF